METRALAEEIAARLSHLRYRTDGLNSEASLLIRLVDARTGEHLVAALIDSKTAHAVRDGLDAQINGSRPRLHLVGGDER